MTERDYNGDYNKEWDGMITRGCPGWKRLSGVIGDSSEVCDGSIRRYNG